MSICIISDSSCDLTREEAEKFGLEIVPFFISFDDKEYLRDDIDITVEDFYQRLITNEKVYPKSSMPNPNDYYDVFKKAAMENMDIICLCITSKFSSSYQSATVAKEMLLDEYPNTKIEVIDTKINTVAQGLFAVEVCKARDAGYTFEQIVDACNEIRETGKIVFTVGSLNYLAKGGRIGRLSSLIGQRLQIKPLIVLENGDILNKGISIGRRRSIEKIIHYVKELIETEKLNPDDYSFAVGYGHSFEEAEKFVANIVDEIKKVGYTIKTKISRIGSTIAVHTGPYSIGIGFIKKIIKD